MISKDCPKPTRLLGSSGAREPMAIQFLVSAVEMERVRAEGAME